MNAVLGTCAYAKRLGKYSDLKPLSPWERGCRESPARRARETPLPLGEGKG
jgi:hypothetical protein